MWHFNRQKTQTCSIDTIIYNPIDVSSKHDSHKWIWDIISIKDNTDFYPESMKPLRNVKC